MVGRKIDVDDLVGVDEIADRLGLKRRQVVHNWRARHPDFPEPVAKLNGGFVWYWPDVAAWARETGRITP
jgi:hypothetical protein